MCGSTDGQLQQWQQPQRAIETQVTTGARAPHSPLIYHTSDNPAAEDYQSAGVLIANGCMRSRKPHCLNINNGGGGEFNTANHRWWFYKPMCTKGRVQGKLEKATLRDTASNISTLVLLLAKQRIYWHGKKTYLQILKKLWEVIWRMNSLGPLKVVVLCWNVFHPGS